MKLTDKEREVLGHLASAWNAWCDLTGKAQGDNSEFQTAIHDAQKLVALRVARRTDPDVWRVPS